MFVFPGKKDISASSLFLGFESIDLDDVKVDTEKEPTDAMTDSSTEESATELEARMAKQTPDTEEEAKILTKITDDDNEYFISKKGYLNYRYLNLLNYLIDG